MQSFDRFYPKDADCIGARYRLPLLIALLLIVSSSLLLHPAPVAAQGTFGCVNKTTADGLGHNQVWGVYAVGSTVYAATSGGLGISTDGGASFTNYTTANGLSSNFVYGVYASGSTVYAAANGGLGISTNGGASFTNYTTANGLGTNYVNGVYAVGSTVYAATDGSGLSISTNGGTSFTNKTTTNGLGDDYVRGVYASGSTVYAATEGGLSISTNGGTSFSNKTSANGLGDSSVNGVYASGSTVYAATGGGLSISTNGGSSFTNYTTANGLGDDYVYGVYAITSTVYAATNGGLSISTNGGTSFTNYTTANGLGANRVYGVYAVSGTVYAATNGGGLSICSVQSPTPEIDVQGNGVSIASGDTTPSSMDYTDFGSVATGNSLVRTFTISNTGTAALTLNGSPLVSVSGSSTFTVTSQPASSSVAAGDSTTFQLTFTPTAAGVVTATVSIANDDSNENPYTFVVQGSIPTPGAALDLDGVNDYVILPTTLNSQFSNNRITVEGWFYPTASSGGGTPMLIGEAYTGDNMVSFALYQEGMVIRCGFYNGSWQQTGGVNLTLNQWQHLACTYDQQNIILYVDGVAMADRAMTAALPAGNGEWYLGRRWDLAEYYTGRMDEVRIWNRALAASEIAAGMNCELGSTASGLVARYNFNQGQTQSNNSAITSLTDGGNSYNGTLTNFALSGSASNWVAPGSAASGVACVETPEIDVQGNGVSIANGDATPVADDHTNFGGVAVNSGNVVRPFTIHNQGAAALALSGSPLVSINGNSDFTVTTQPGSSSIAAGDNTTFTLTFAPSATGYVTATVTIANDDSDENPYTFVVGGTGSLPLVCVNKTTADGLGDNQVNGVYANGSTIYAATYRGLSISTDGGATFTNKTTDDGLGHNQVYGVYASGNTVYAGTMGGLSISTDGGVTFTNKTTANGLGDNSVNGIYASGSTLYVATEGGVSISTDGGATFTNRTTADGLGDDSVIGIYVSGSTVYATTYGGGLSISTDGGATFITKTTANGLGDDYVYGVYASGSTVYAATAEGLSISTDGGATFTNRTTDHGLGGDFISGVYVSDSTVYVATDNGLSISADDGATFINKTPDDSGLGDYYVSGVYASGSTVYASTDDGLTICTATAPTSPEIDVQGNGVSIANSDSTPDPADHTDFGSVDIASATVTRTFTISNTGDAALTLSGSPAVALSGADAFSVSSQPSTPIAAGNSTTFQIVFDPSAEGVVTATVSIANDDSDENPFTFTIHATGADQANKENQVTQDGYQLGFQATVQPCSNADFPIHTITPRLLNNSAYDFIGIYFQVIELRYVTDQGSHIPILCNADTGTGTGVGARVTPPLTDDLSDNRFSNGESFAQPFRVGLPLRLRYRLFVNMFGRAEIGRSADGGDLHLAQLVWEFDDQGNPVGGPAQIFLPLLSK